MILEQARRLVHDLVNIWVVVGVGFAVFAFVGLLEDYLARRRRNRRARSALTPQLCARRPYLIVDNGPVRPRSTRLARYVRPPTRTG